MNIRFYNNKYNNHFINIYAIFAICIGIGKFIRLGFVICKTESTRTTKHIWIEIMFFYWRVLIDILEGKNKWQSLNQSTNR